MNTSTLMRDILPYGLVTRITARRLAARERRRIAERVAMLRALTPEDTPQQPRLNMGCGTHHEPGWFNADAGPSAPLSFTLTADTPLPFEDGSLDVVFSEHFIEHLELATARHFIHESARVLRPGGVFRVSCPDLAVIAGYARGGDDWRELACVYETLGDFPPGVLTRPDLVINWAFYGHGHRHLWTLEALADELRRAGFADVARMPHGVSRFHGAAIEVRTAEAFCSLVAEAVRI